MIVFRFREIRETNRHCRDSLSIDCVYEWNACLIQYSYWYLSCLECEYTQNGIKPVMFDPIIILENFIFNLHRIRYKWASDAWTFWNMTSQIVHNVKVSVCILWILKGLNLCSGKFWSWQTCVISIQSKNETVLTSSNFLLNTFIETCVPRYQVTYHAMQTYTFLLIFI